MTDHLHALPIGHQLGEYRIERVLGSGGFGITYYAWERHLNKPVAIKEYLPNEFALRTDATTVRPKSTSDADDYQWGLERFLDEARTLARFDHPHLNKVYRFFEDNGTAYMVLEYIEGETLSELLRRESSLEQARLRRLLEELLSGLEEVHDARFVHRDVKPGNIMLRTDGTAVLLDFGAARQAVGQRSKSITSILTPGYAPIEQYAQKMDSVGPWSDLYALGMVAYRCISGLGDGELPDAVSRALMSKDGEDKDLTPAAIAGKGRYDQPLLEAIDWAIKVTEGERPQDVAALRRALSGSRKPASVSKAAAGRPDSEMNRPGRKWTLPLLLLCVTVILSATGAGGWWVLIGEERSYWRDVACTEEAAVRAYIKRYPAGRYEGKAQVCLAAIERKQKQEAADRLATEVEQTRLAEENRKAGAAAKHQQDEVGRLAAAEEKKKREAELKRLADEKRQAEAELKKLAEEKRKAEAAAKRQQEEAARLAAAEEKKKREAELKRLADEKHQAEAELKRLADEKHQAEAELKRLADEKRKVEAARLAAAEEERKEAARRAAAEEERKEAARRAAAEEERKEAARRAAAEEERKEAARLAAAEEERKEAARLAAAEEERKEAARLAAAEEERKETARLAAAEEERKEAARLAAAAEEERKEAARLAAAEEERKEAARLAAAEEERKREVERARLAEESRKAEAASQSKLEAERSRFIQAVGREPSANFTDANGWTDLHYAAVLNFSSLAKRLLQSGAIVNAKLKSDREPFTDELKAILRRFGENYDLWNRDGYTPLYYAAWNNAVETATLLIERGAAVNAKDDNGETPLHRAAYKNAVETATLLIERGAAVNAKNSIGVTPLYRAASNNAVETATLLIERGAAVNAKNDYGYTPLHLATYKNAVETATLLIERGAAVNAKNDDGETPLHYAASTNDVATATLLIERGAAVNAKDDNGWTPLHSAAGNNAVETATLLIERGAAVNAKDNDGDTPLAVALRNDAYEVAALLRRHGGTE